MPPFLNFTCVFYSVFHALDECHSKISKCHPKITEVDVIKSDLRQHFNYSLFASIHRIIYDATCILELSKVMPFFSFATPKQGSLQRDLPIPLIGGSPYEM